ncbi:uncharacterized protein LOC116172603 [Photinus pyralis]|nr:uncharacterized protein LOC116172603 [Photinus pyralis]
MDIPHVKLRYGSYEYNGIIRHRPHHLIGVIRCLTNLGFEIEIVPSIHRNRLVVEILGRTVFQCNQLNLPFNMECDDTVSRRVIDVIREASRRMYSYGNVPKFTPRSRGMRALQEAADAQDTGDHFDDDTLMYVIPRPIDPREEFAKYSFPYTHLA